MFQNKRETTACLYESNKEIPISLMNYTIFKFCIIHLSIQNLK
jgi:hypothetical protein